ncbi:1,2-dihydroxy-3-keto-5-methylthiopentene dioxygenase [Ramicandelaber brevisporus]|nr:1,2-dihydroxy-3-keto-5-methylthiopentene dioxygenase [Ramicandelaber brevisporus]
MRAYLFADDGTDSREAHELSPSIPVTEAELNESGVLYWKITGDVDEQLGQINKIAAEREYKNRDEIAISPTTLPNYEEKLKIFFTEHLHEDEEIRYILEGSGFFDIRDRKDRWVRIKVEQGDLLVLPAGIYHRFTLDTKNWLKAMRLFKEEPKWTPINRPADENPFRVAYVNVAAA